MSKKFALVVNDHGISYFRPFKHLGLECTRNVKMLWENPDDIALVIFTGGEDVSPNLYGHKKHPSTGTNPHRDKVEVEVFERALALNKPMAGICRGAQFLCVMAGGKLVQHITGHAGADHYLTVRGPDGNTYTSPERVTSTHHQMQYPFTIKDGDFEIIAWSNEPRSTIYAFDGEEISPEKADDRLKIEPDVVFYSKINALSIQYHPEWMEENTWGFQYAQEVVNTYLGAKIKKLVDPVASK